MYHKVRWDTKERQEKHTIKMIWKRPTQHQTMDLEGHSLTLIYQLSVVPTITNKTKGTLVHEWG